MSMIAALRAENKNLYVRISKYLINNDGNHDISYWRIILFIMLGCKLQLYIKLYLIIQYNIFTI